MRAAEDREGFPGAQVLDDLLRVAPLREDDGHADDVGLVLGDRPLERLHVERAEHVVEPGVMTVLFQDRADDAGAELVAHRAAAHVDVGVNKQDFHGRGC